MLLPLRQLVQLFVKVNRLVTEKTLIEEAGKQEYKMRRVNLLHLKRSYKLPLIFLLVAILLFLMVPHYTESDELGMQVGNQRRREVIRGIRQSPQVHTTQDVLGEYLLQF